MDSHAFNLDTVDKSWFTCLEKGLKQMNPVYLEKLSQSSDWLPGANKIFNAFSLPLARVNYVLFGESPYPRLGSANGYAFWDGLVHQLWSETGFSKRVNRATSLRNFLKMLLVAENLIDKNDLSQAAIAKIDKHSLVQTNDEFFANLLNNGFLLLNATLVLQAGSKHQDARAWYPFITELLACLLKERPQAKFILFGRIANTIDSLLNYPHVESIYAEHPYNHSFITNPSVIAFFKPFHLLKKSTSS